MYFLWPFHFAQLPGRWCLFKFNFSSLIQKPFKDSALCKIDPSLGQRRMKSYTNVIKGRQKAGVSINDYKSALGHLKVSLYVNISVDTGSWRNENSGKTKKHCKKKGHSIGGWGWSWKQWSWFIYWIPTRGLTPEGDWSVRHIPFFKHILPIWVSRQNYVK